MTRSATSHRQLSTSHGLFSAIIFKTARQFSGCSPYTFAVPYPAKNIWEGGLSQNPTVQRSAMERSF